MFFESIRTGSGNHALAQDAGLPLLRMVYGVLKGMGLLADWSVVALSVVAREGNHDPDHQDKFTGSLAYQRVR